MGLAASGEISLRDINSELGIVNTSTVMDLRSSEYFWLAGVADGTADRPILPNDFHDKHACKLTASPAFITPTAGVWTFASQSFGASFADRRICCMVFFMEKASADVPSGMQVTVKIGDATATSAFSPGFWHGGAGNTRLASCTITSGFPSGTSGNVVITVTSSTGLTIANVLCSVRLFAMGENAWTQTSFNGSNIGSTSTLTDDAQPFNIDARGSILVGAVCYASGAHTLTLNGVTERAEEDHGSNRRIVYGYDTNHVGNAAATLSMVSTGTITAAQMARQVWEL